MRTQKSIILFAVRSELIAKYGTGLCRDSVNSDNTSVVSGYSQRLFTRLDEVKLVC